MSNHHEYNLLNSVEVQIKCPLAQEFIIKALSTFTQLSMNLEEESNYSQQVNIRDNMVVNCLYSTYCPSRLQLLISSTS